MNWKKLFKSTKLPDPTAKLEQLPGYTEHLKNGGWVDAKCYTSGNLQYYYFYNKNGVLHRENNPAHMAWSYDGSINTIAYHQNGKAHRLDGPASTITNITTEKIEKTYCLYGHDVTTYEKVTEELKGKTLSLKNKTPTELEKIFTQLSDLIYQNITEKILQAELLNSTADHYTELTGQVLDTKLTPSETSLSLFRSVKHYNYEEFKKRVRYLLETNQEQQQTLKELALFMHKAKSENSEKTIEKMWYVIENTFSKEAAEQVTLKLQKYSLNTEEQLKELKSLTVLPNHLRDYKPGSYQAGF